jgi:molybdate transport system substrate-binding protein
MQYFWAALVLIGLATGAAPVAPGITVSAAISLTDALTACAQAYKAGGGGDVRFNFAGSNVLARQIVNGAPVDLFVSADREQMRLVERAGAIATGTKVELLHNRLAVIVPSSGPALTWVQDLANPAVKRIAIGDPGAVPAGVYAKRYLQSAGVWAALRAKIVPVANVRAALRAAETANVDAAIVYASDLIGARGVRRAFLVDGPDAPAISYPAAVVASSTNRTEAARFLAFLQGPTAAGIFTRYGFEPVRQR